MDDRSLEEIIPPEGIPTEQVKSEIMDLEKAREILSRPTSTPDVVEARIDDPLTKVEESLANYISRRSEIDIERNDFSKLIMKKIADRIDSLNTEQLLTLFGTDRVTGTDMMSKFMGPTAQIISTKQQDKIAAEGRRAAALEKSGGAGVQIAIGNVGNNPAAMQAANQDAPQSALQGMTMFYQLASAIQKMEDKKKEEE